MTLDLPTLRAQIRMRMISEVADCDAQIAHHTDRRSAIMRSLEQLDADQPLLPASERELVSPKAAAHLWGVSERTARRRAANPKLGFRKGRAWFLFRDMIEVS